MFGRGASASVDCTTKDKKEEKKQENFISSVTCSEIHFLIFTLFYWLIPFLNTKLKNGHVQRLYFFHYFYSLKF